MAGVLEQIALALMAMLPLDDQSSGGSGGLLIRREHQLISNLL